MEEKLAALHGYRLPTYKRDGPGQPRLDDPCPTFLLKTHAQPIPPPVTTKTLRDWVLLEDELLYQRRGIQLTTAAGDSSRPEWTPEQRQQFLKLLRKRRHEEVEDLTVCDVDVHLASLAHGSQLVPPMAFPYEYDLTNMHRSPEQEEAEAQFLIDDEEAVDREIDLEIRTKSIILNGEELKALFTRFLDHAQDPIINQKLEKLPPLLTKQARKALQEGVYGFTADLVAETESLAEECESLWTRRRPVTSFEELKRDLRLLIRWKRKGLDLKVKNSFSEMFGREEFFKNIGVEIVEMAKKRVGAHNLGPRSEFLPVYNSE